MAAKYQTTGNVDLRFQVLEHIRWYWNMSFGNRSYSPVWHNRGATQICRCAHAWTNVLKYTPKHILVKMQNSSPKQGFCLKFYPLNRFESKEFKGCGMGRWLVLVSPCFRKNIVATCEIGSFLCSLNNLLQKNIIFLFFGNQISKWRSFEKRANFDLLFTFFSRQIKVTKIPSAHISLTYIHIFCLPYWLFLSHQFWKKYNFFRYGFSLVCVLVLIPIRAILEQSINNKRVSKI